MSFNELAHMLLKDPYRVSRAEIAGATDYQLVNWYCRGEPEGDVKLSRDDARFRERFERHWRGKGLTAEQVEAKWVEEGHGKHGGTTAGH